VAGISMCYKAGTAESTFFLREAREDSQRAEVTVQQKRTE